MKKEPLTLPEQGIRYTLTRAEVEDALIGWLREYTELRFEFCDFRFTMGLHRTYVVDVFPEEYEEW